MQSHSNNLEPNNPETCVDNDNVFSKPWEDSDVVLVVEGKDFHVHRSILSLQSRVFKAMFNGNFKDASQDKIELKEDTNQKAMLQFLKLLYPPNMLDRLDEVSVSITDENVFEILQLADKYGAINIIKQCMKEAGRLKPENAMRLLPFAERNELQLEEIYDIIARHVSTDKLSSFAPEIGKSVHIDALDKKCRLYEDVVRRANTAIHHLLQKYVHAKTSGITGTTGIRSNETSGSWCVRHNHLGVRDFKQARKCANCLEIYKILYIDRYVYTNDSPVMMGSIPVKIGTPFGISVAKPTMNEHKNEPSIDSKRADFIDLLQITDDIATSLKHTKI